MYRYTEGPDAKVVFSAVRIAIEKGHCIFYWIDGTKFVTRNLVALCDDINSHQQRMSGRGRLRLVQPRVDGETSFSEHFTQRERIMGLVTFWWTLCSMRCLQSYCFGIKPSVIQRESACGVEVLSGLFLFSREGISTIWFGLADCQVLVPSHEVESKMMSLSFGGLITASSTQYPRSLSWAVAGEEFLVRMHSQAQSQRSIVSERHSGLTSWVGSSI